MGNLRMTTAAALIKFLDNQYVSLDGVEEKFVEGIFTIFGHGIVCGLGHALYEDKGGLKVYQGRNEQGMAHTAAGFARQSNRRRIIACASSIGPGAANMVTAAACATANNIPLLLFTGDTFSTRQPDPVLQQIEQFHDAGITTSDAFRPVTRYWDRVNRPEQLMSAMKNAMRVLTDPEWTGSVCITLPQDVQGETYEYPDYFFAKRVHRIARPLPDAEEVSEAVKLIEKKKKPLVILGGGVRYSEAGNKLLAFCEQHNIPFAETQSGKSVLPSSHPLNLGGIGVTGNSMANEIASKADLIIGIGTRLTDFTTGSKELFRNEEVSFLLINISRYHAEKLDALPVTGDAKVSIKELAKRINPDYKSAYKEEIKLAKDDWKKEMDFFLSNTYDENYQSIIKAKEDGVEREFVEATGGNITQTAAIGVIREMIEEDAIVVGASGSLPGDLQRMWTTDVKDSYHMEYGYSCMGYEISAALGAKLAFPERSCYAMVGDGAFMMLHSEAATALQERKKITILLFDNCGFGCINNLQMSSGMGSMATMFRYREEEEGNKAELEMPKEGALIPTDFAMIARGYGMAAYTAKSIEELKTALAAAREQENTVLIDIKVLPKSMTDGYVAWWHVGIGESSNKDIQKVYENKIEKLKKARKY